MSDDEKWEKPTSNCYPCQKLWSSLESCAHFTRLNLKLYHHNWVQFLKGYFIQRNIISVLFSYELSYLLNLCFNKMTQNSITELMLVFNLYLLYNHKNCSLDYFFKNFKCICVKFMVILPFNFPLNITSWCPKYCKKVGMPFYVI